MIVEEYIPTYRHMSIEYKKLKKGQKLKTSQLQPMTGIPLVTSILLESPKQGRGVKDTLLVDTKGSEVGLFDEMGSVYGNDVQLALLEDVKCWVTVIDKPEEVIF
jgi:hypothetical protein|tara:strand:- start:134 stop:448 length:315 start_codon:yes stop_codon:yes gene_type:complete